MSGADLVVDLQLLASTRDSLEKLHTQFESAGEIVDQSEGGVGERNLVSTLEDFASDWKTHRENLLKSIEAVHKMAASSYTTYVSTDQKLAQSLKHSTTTSSAKPSVR